PAPPHTDIQDSNASPLGARYGQMNPYSAGSQPLQDPPSHRLIVQLARDVGVLQKPLHALLETVAGAGQAQGRNNLADLQALAAQDAQRHGCQVYEARQRFQGQIAVQLSNQVGKHLVLWFDHQSLHGGGCSLGGYERSRPSPRRLLSPQPWFDFYCPLIRAVAQFVPTARLIPLPPA